MAACRVKTWCEWVFFFVRQGDFTVGDQMDSIIFTQTNKKSGI